MFPLPENVGVGFSSPTPLDVSGYLYSQVGNYHNYHYTSQNRFWPQSIGPGTAIMDGFSPNLNKSLHAGHLKNLAVASALLKICGKKAVAMLGASQGINEGALEELKEWYALAQYEPTIYLDIDLPKIAESTLEKGEGEYAGTLITQGRNSPIVIYKSDGSSSYAAHDISFASIVAPTHYLTGAEQKPHFANLGLGDKHHSLGLLLGADGKKMASSGGNPVSAKELLESVVAALRETAEPNKLAWNILAYNFNSGSKAGNTKFNLQQWVKPESPGMHVSHTYAKLNKALVAAGAYDDLSSHVQSLMEVNDSLKLLGFVSYFNYYYNKSQKDFESYPLANYAYQLSKKLSALYSNKSNKIVGGDQEYVSALYCGTLTLKKCMELLGMYPIDSV